jgi:hypothetical protein
VTSLKRTENSARQLDDDIYCVRGDMEKGMKRHPSFVRSILRGTKQLAEITLHSRIAIAAFAAGFQIVSKLGKSRS